MIDSSNDNPPDTEATDPATVFRSLASIVYTADDYFQVYQAVCASAPLLVSGCDHASLMLRRNDEFITAAANDDTARRIDELEMELGEGPCLDAITEEAAHIDPDLTNGSPWPDLSKQVLKQTTVRGMAGFRVIIDERKVGALNLFSDTPDAMNDRSVDQGAVLASFVSVALMAASRQEEASTLGRGLHSNREIGKAIGLMMAFHRISDDEAFALLRQASQDMNVKVAKIARDVVQHHNQRPAADS